MNKRLLISKIISQLVEELETWIKAAQAAHAESTHEQSKAENKYDTRALDSSYLAQGQSRQAAELEAALAAFNSLEATPFPEGSPVDVGALVELETSGQKSFYFVGAKAGGMEVLHENQEVIVITLQSPLGKQLDGKKQGDVVSFSLGGRSIQYRIAAIS